VGLSTRGRGTYDKDKPPVFILADRGTGERYVIPAKTADESTIRLLLANRQQESLTVYTDGFRAYEPLEEDDAFTREYVVHGDGEYVDGDVHVNTCESHGSLVRSWLSPHRGVSKDKLTLYLRAFQLRREVFRKPGEEGLKVSSLLHYDSPTISATRAYLKDNRVNRHKNSVDYLFPPDDSDFDPGSDDSDDWQNRMSDQTRRLNDIAQDLTQD